MRFRLFGINAAAFRSHLYKNLVWSFLGSGLPALVAILTIPKLLHEIGVARFGILSLAWIFVGYFSLFDLGLGRALTQLVAGHVGRGREDKIPAIVWVGVILMGLLGIVGAAVVWLVTPWLVTSKLEIPGELRSETLSAFYCLAASIPVVIVTTGLRGVLEARQRFDMVNIVKIPSGILTYLAPLSVLPYSNKLPALVASLVVVRTVACLAYLVVCLKLYPDLRRRPVLDFHYLKDMLSFGGWMTLSNIVGPLLLYLGRLLLAVAVSVEAVAYFSTSYDVVINLLLIPSTLLSVFFPLFAEQATRGFSQVRVQYRRALLLNAVLIVPLALATFVMAKPTLAWWISPDFAEKSFRVAQWLALGVLINSFGLVSQALIQALGRPDLTAKLHVAELVAYIPYLWWLVAAQGIDGAAIAWVIRVTISAIVLWWLARLCLATGRLPARKESF